MEEEKPTLMNKLKRFTKECKRVLLITKKPTMLEFRTIVKVSGIGMILIGFIGFIIHIIRQVLI
jgi:protein transport protein SEC61 subunit gamma-like protein